MLEILRPFGLGRIVFVCWTLMTQAVLQLVAVVSVLPFLTAAADMPRFRSSAMGRVMSPLLGVDDHRVLVMLGVGSLILLFVGNAFTLVAEWIRTRYAHLTGHRIREQLIALLLARKYEYFLRANSSILQKQLTEDVISFTQSVLLPTLDIIARLSLILLLLAALLLLEPIVFGFAAAFAVIYFFLVISPMRRAASVTSEAVKQRFRDLHFEIGQAISGIKPIIVSDRQLHFRDRCAKASHALALLLPRTVFFTSLPRSGLEVLVFGGLIMWVLVTLVTRGALLSIMPRVGLVAIIAYRLMPSLQLVIGQSIGIASGRYAMDEVLLLLREQQATSAGAGAARRDRHHLVWTNDIRFDRVTFGYVHADRPALQDISFTISKGERVAFVGPTGSGKSTLVDLILGLLSPTSGTILIDGEPLTPERRPAWRSVVGYVPQDIFLLDSSIAENIAFGVDRTDLDLERVRAVAAQAQATEFIGRRDGAFWAQIGERGLRLSGGQRQRLSLARALYEKPNVLLLDEATSALDPQTEQQVVAAVGEENDRLTIITVTHRLSTVVDYDRLYFIQAGLIKAVGTYAELVETHPPFRQFARA